MLALTCIARPSVCQLAVTPASGYTQRKCYLVQQALAFGLGREGLLIGELVAACELAAPHPLPVGAQFLQVFPTQTTPGTD